MKRKTEVKVKLVSAASVAAAVAADKTECRQGNKQ